jgi:hypothetical protein
VVIPAAQIQRAAQIREPVETQGAVAIRAVGQIQEGVRTQEEAQIQVEVQTRHQAVIRAVVRTLATVQNQGAGAAVLPVVVAAVPIQAAAEEDSRVPEEEAFPNSVLVRRLVGSTSHPVPAPNRALATSRSYQLSRYPLSAIDTPGRLTRRGRPTTEQAESIPISASS